MAWVVAVACAISAALHLRLLVPRLREPDLEPGEPAPRYATLAPTRHVVLLAVVVLALASVLHLVPPEQFVVWFGYLGAGAALVWVDLRTTWLPLTLHRVCLAQVVAGIAWLPRHDWPTALTSVGGGVGAFLVFWLVWRFSSAFGYGDVRLAALVGMVGGMRGLDGWLLALVCGTLVGAVWGVVHALRRQGAGGPQYFAYGPALWVGPVVAVAISGW